VFREKLKGLGLTLFSVSFGIVICLCLAAVLGENPFYVLKVLIVGAFGSLTNIGYTLFYTTPLIFTGLSVALAFHGGLFNIGAEGQLYMGALFLAAVGILAPDLPPGVAPVVGIGAALLGGGIWGSLAGWLKSYRGSHEVIVTIMLNFISYSICGFAIMNIFKNPNSQNPETYPIGAAYHLGGFGEISTSSPLNLSFILACLAALAVWILLFKTKWGYELRLTGHRPETARRAGIPVRLRLMQAMCLSGALAGLVGVNEIMGFSHKFRDQFSAGYGFIGIAVALLGRNRPAGVLGAALLFGALQKGSLDLELDTEKITRDMAGVMQAFIILFVASESYWVKLYESSRARFLKSRPPTPAEGRRP
jgi:general nucleoside transport system permease protein